MSSNSLKDGTNEQYVCVVCGFNMIGSHPDKCPFCNATSDNFLTSEECGKKYKIEATDVTDTVKCLRSVPKLGLEHSAYFIETEDINFWIDCPSSFNSDLKAVDNIFYTHHHFLGAGNQYRSRFIASTYIHELDSKHEIIKNFKFDSPFFENFSGGGLSSHHIGGHTPGFTIYIFNDILFICDYVFLGNGSKMSFNPYGPEAETKEGGARIKEVLKDKKIKTVCGFNYFMDFPEWNEMFEALLSES